MSAHDDMFDLEVLDGVLDHTQRVQVARVQDVGDVAVDEDIARLEAEDGGFGDAGVGATDPEDLGGLAFCERGEERGVVGGGIAGPGFVLGQGAGEVVYMVEMGMVLVERWL